MGKEFPPTRSILPGSGCSEVSDRCRHRQKPQKTHRSRSTSLLSFKLRRDGKNINFWEDEVIRGPLIRGAGQKSIQNE